MAAMALMSAELLLVLLAIVVVVGDGRGHGNPHGVRCFISSNRSY
jgi:hypothetical protein